MATLRSMFEGKIDLTDPENWDAVRAQQWDQVAGDLNQPLVGDPDAGFPIDITVPPPAMYFGDLDAVPGGTHNFSRKPQPGYTPGQTQNFPRKPQPVPVDTSDWNIPAAPIGMTGSLSTMGITGLMATEDVQQFIPPPSDFLYIPTFGAIEPPPQIDYMAGVQVEFAQPWQPPEPVGPVRQRVLDEAHYYASIKPQGPTVNVTMPQVGGTLLAPQPQAPSSPDDFFRDIEILPGGMALPGSPLDNFLDWVREGFREAPGNYYGDAQLAAMQQERLAGMGLAGASPGPGTNPFAEYSRAYDENPDARWQERFSAGGEAFFGSVGAWIGHGAGQAGNAVMSSPVGEPITWAMWNWGKLDDLVIAPTPALLGYSAVETVWGPWEARERWLATPEAQGLLEAQGSATPQMIRQRYGAVLEQSGRAIADEWLAGYQEEQARLNARSDALVPLLQDGGLGALGDYFSRQGQMLQGYVEQVPQAYEAMKTARNPYTYGIFPSDPRYEDFKQVPYGAYGGWNADLSRNMPIEATYTQFANWIVTKPQRIEQALEFAEIADTYASSETDVGYEPEELRLAAAQARAEAAELEAMGPEKWIDQNISLTTRIGYNLLFDWTNLVSWGMDAFGLSGSAMRAARASQGVVGVDDAAAAANVAAGVARGNVVDLADDGYQVLQGGFLPYAFDSRGRVFYPDVKLRQQQAAAVGITTDPKSKTAFVEARNISLDAALGVAAPSMEDDVLDAIEAAGRGLTGDMLTVDELADLDAAYGDVATVAAELAGYTTMEEWYYSPRRVTNMPAEVRNLQLPRVFFEDPSLHRLMDTETVDRLRSYLGSNWMEFQASSGAPVFEAGDIYGRIAQREDTWGIAAGIMQQADAAIAAGGPGVVQLAPELLGDGAQLWEVLGNVQGLATHGQWSLRGTPADILATGRIEIVPGQLVGRELHEMQTTMSNVELLKRIETELAGYSGASSLTAREQLELAELQHMRQSVIGQSDLSWADFFNTLSPEARRVAGELGHTQYTELVNRVGGTSIVRLDWGDVDQIVPSKDLYSTFDRSVLAADTLIQDAVRGEWDAYRAGLAGRAERFQAASWLYEQFAAGSLPDQQPFMATIDDLATARTADQMMEASDFGYHIDWESMTVGRGGARVQIVPGAAAEPSVMRSAEPWLQTRVTQALGTSHPTMTDIALRGYGQDVLDTLERGGTGVYLAGGEDARTAYRQISDVAAEAGLDVQLLDVDEGGFIYRLGPAGEGVEQYPQLAAFDGSFPGKTSSAFKGGAEYLEDLYIRNREAWRANRPRNFWDVIPFVDDVEEVAEEVGPIGIVRSRAETEARMAAIRAEEELGRDLGPVVGQVVDPVTVLSGPTSGEMVYMVPRPGTWYINNKGDLVLKPQSKWVNDPTAKSGRKWEAGFTFYTDPAGAVQGTPYEDLFGTPQQAYLNANPRVGREYRWGGQTVEPPASLGWADDAEIERGIMGVDEEVLDFSNRVYDNPVDVGGIEDLYWFQRPDDTSLPMSRPRSPYNPLIPKSDLAFYTEEGNEGLFYAENLAQYQMSAERGLTSSPAALSKAQREQRDALLQIQAMRQQIDDLHRPPYGQVGDTGDYLGTEEARLAAMELRAELGLLEAEYAGKYGSRPPRNDVLALSQFQTTTQYSGGEYGAIEAALADYPIIAIPRSVFEEQTALAKTQYGDPLFSSQAAGETSTTLRTKTRSDPFSIPSGSYTVGATQPAALPRQTSSTGTGYEAFVGDLYRRGAALAQSLSEDTRYQLYRDHILGSLGFANRKGEGLWVEGPVQIPAGPVGPGGSVFDVLNPEDYLPKGVTALPGSAPAGDVPQIALSGMAGAALKAENWKGYAIKTGAWHEPAQASWKGQVPWWMRHYGNQYYPSNEAGLREMLGTLLSRGPDEVPQELVDNPGLLKDYQLLAGTALGYDTSEWELTFSGYTTSMHLSPKELDPTYWPALANAGANKWSSEIPRSDQWNLQRFVNSLGGPDSSWASDIPLNVRERIQADWVREMERQQLLPRGQDWYRDYRNAFMGGSRVEGPAPYPGSPAAADAGFMTRELDANLVADWDIDAMKRAAAAVKKLGFTPEAQAAHELWQEIWPGLVEHIDFRPAQINRDFWAAVDKTAQAYKDVPKWMDDLFLRVQEARA
ncbi:MAG: hypothetical protein M9936_31885, partial [Caldilinea sp.]|nr:hypothetical protein [Caldilinea sp.]